MKECLIPINTDGEETEVHDKGTGDLKEHSDVPVSVDKNVEIRCHIVNGI